MSLDNTIKYNGKEFKLTSRQPQGIGEMLVFREIKNRHASIIDDKELSEDCKIFQVYRNNGDFEIDSYNNSRHLIPSLKRFLKKEMSRFLN